MAGQVAGQVGSVDSLGGGDGLTTGLELSHVVLDHSFKSWDEVEGSGDGRLLSPGQRAQSESQWCRGADP